MANDLLSLAGWYFLPNLVTGYLQSMLYAVFIRAGDPKPQPGTQRFNQDRKKIHILVIVLYLLYTIYDADYQLQTAGDFYQVLGVPHNVDDRALQSRFRRLTVQYHPDKATGPNRAAIEAVYVSLKLARDTLIDPAKRFAYDRMGPEILQWRHCKTIRDFVYFGMQRTAAYYIGSMAVLVLFGVLGYLEAAKFWRYLVMATLFATEVYTMTRPEFPGFLTGIANPILTMTRLRLPYLPFQMIALLRKLAITFFIALSQLGPLLRDPNAGAQSDTISPQHLDRLDGLTRATDEEVTRLLALDLNPYMGEENTKRDLKKTLNEWLVYNTVRNDPEVVQAVGQELNRRREQGVLGLP